jgi:dTDP-4-amino-4,6-dideoxygalactose transaminase
VIIVDQGGVPVDLDPIRALCDPRGITVIEDAACGSGSTYRGRPVGAGAEIAAWSFHPRKILTTGEGGMVTTNDGDAADRIRLLRAHAASVSTADRDRAQKVVLETYPEVGFNYKITDIQSAIGVVQMGRVDEIVAERKRLGRRYDDLLASQDGVETPYVPDGYGHVYQSYNVRLRPGRTQEDVMRAMLDLGVATRRIFSIHDQPAYAGSARVLLPHTEAAAATTILLPMFVGLTDDEQDQVVNALEKCL